MHACVWRRRRRRRATWSRRATALVSIEAMKIETTVPAPVGGTVSRVAVSRRPGRGAGRAARRAGGRWLSSPALTADAAAPPRTRSSVGDASRAQRVDAPRARRRRCGTRGTDRRAAGDGDDLPLRGRVVRGQGQHRRRRRPDDRGLPRVRLHARAIVAGGASGCVDAGALFVGKTNLDQFATGLVGTALARLRHLRQSRRSRRTSPAAPAPARRSRSPPGWSRSRSAPTPPAPDVCPAACCGIVGLKPTRGLISTRGVVPASRSFDCVSTFTTSCADAARVLGIAREPGASRWPPSRPACASACRVTWSGSATATHRGCFDAAVAQLSDAGAELVSIDLTGFLDAGRLLYGSALVAERPPRSASSPPRIRRDGPDGPRDRQRGGAAPGTDVVRRVRAARADPRAHVADVGRRRRHRGADRRPPPARRGGAPRSVRPERRARHVHELREPARPVRGGGAGGPPCQRAAVRRVARRAPARPTTSCSRSPRD